MLVHPHGSGKTSFINSREPGTVFPNYAVQSNAVEVSCDKVFSILEATDFTLLADNTKEHRLKSELTPIQYSFKGKLYDDIFYLKSGYSYDIVSDWNVDVPAGEVGLVIVRSTLNRNGIFATSGLYDSGYNGVVGLTLHVRTGDAYIQKGSLIAQFLTLQAESVKLYNGSYGLASEHDKAYRA